MRASSWFALAGAGAFLYCSGACSPPPRTLPPCVSASAQATALALATSSRPAIVAAVGDIADCDGGRQAWVADLIGQLSPDAVFALGDLAYPNGSLEDFLGCYAPSFGRFRAITHPVVGNHEYHTPHAGAYYAYFCGAAGEPFKGWYSFDVGRWHVVALNSVCGGDLDVDTTVPSEFGGCGDASPQVAWLRADLAAHADRCRLVMWHHPRWSSSTEGSSPEVAAFWRVVTDLSVDVVLNGHAHDYQRFPPMSAEGRRDARGPRTFVVGTGGSPISSFDPAIPVRSEVRDDSSRGALLLELRDRSYAWRYVPIAGDAFNDEGEAPCH